MQGRKTGVLFDVANVKKGTHCYDDVKSFWNACYVPTDTLWKPFDVGGSKILVEKSPPPHLKANVDEIEESSSDDAWAQELFNLEKTTEHKQHGTPPPKRTLESPFVSSKKAGSRDKVSLLATPKLIFTNDMDNDYATVLQSPIFDNDSFPSSPTRLKETSDERHHKQKDLEVRPKKKEIKSKKNITTTTTTTTTRSTLDLDESNENRTRTRGIIDKKGKEQVDDDKGKKVQKSLEIAKGKKGKMKNKQATDDSEKESYVPAKTKGTVLGKKNRNNSR